MLFGEITFLPGLDVDDADQAVLDDQRNRELGMNVGQRFDVEVFARDVGDQLRLARLGGAPGDALTNLHANALGDFGRIADLKTDVEFLALFIEQENGEDLVVDDLANKFGDAAQGGLQVERGVDDVGHFEQKRFRFVGRPRGWGASFSQVA